MLSAGASCNIFAHRKNSNRISQLHKDLLELTNSIEDFDREQANKVLYLSLSDTFLELHSENLIFDSSNPDAEPILASMFEEAPRSYTLSLTYEAIEEALAKKFNFGVSSYSEALKKVIEFNKNKFGGRYTFLATLEALDDGTYRTKVVLNTEDNQKELIRTIQDRLFAEDIEARLKDYHVRVDATDDKINKYDTRNPKKDVDGYYGLIQLNKGMGNLDSLYMETGHFLIDALGRNNPIVKKMFSAIRQNPKIVETLLGEEALREFNITNNTNWEALGHIVGKFLKDYQLKTPNLLKHFKNLIIRAVQWISTKIPLGDRQYRRDLYKVKTLALKIAKSFLHGTFEGRVERAISTNTVLYDTHALPYNLFLSTFKKDIQRLIEWQKELLIAGVNTSGLSKQIKAMTKAYKDALKETKTSTVNVFNNWQMAITDVMYNVFQSIGQNLDTLVQRLDSLIVRINSGENIPLTDMANILHEAQLLQLAIKDVVEPAAKNYASFLTLDLIDDIKSEVKNIEEYLANVSGVSGNFTNMIREAQRIVCLKLLTQVNGSQFVAIELHISSKGLFKGIERKSDLIIDLSQELYMSSTIGATSWWTRWVDAMADCPDIINLLVALAIEEEKHKAIQEVNKVKDDMIELYEEMRKVGIAHTKELFERDKNGHITNYIISERLWSEWDKDFEESKEAMRKKCYEDNKDKEGWTTRQQMYSSALYNKTFHIWLRDFHNTHSTLLELTNSNGKPVLNGDKSPRMVWVPALANDSDNNKNRNNKKTYGGQLDKLNDKLKAVYKKYMVLKRKLDSLLDRPGQTNPLGVKAPQFKMSIFGRKYGLAHRWVRSFDYLPYLGDNPNDTAFGSDDDTFDDSDLLDSEGTDIYDTNFRNTLNSLNRLPVYGVKKIDPKELSTDLVFTTIAYAQMAYNYNKLNNVVRAVEQLSDYIYNKRITTESGKSASKANKDKKDRTREYDRFRDYMSAVVYNKTTDMSKPLSKLLGRIGSTVSYLRLGWNANSQIINGVTGLWEIMKEAGNEEYSVLDFWWAYGTYLKQWLLNIGHNIVHSIKFSKHGMLNRSQPIEGRTKLNLLEHKYDFRGNREEQLRGYKVMSRGYGILKGRNITSMSLAIMSFTDDFMSRVGILAAMHHIKLRNKNTGKMSRLWDIYEVKNGKIQIKNNGKETDWEVRDYQREKIQELLMSKTSNLTALGDLGNATKEAVYILNDKYDPRLTRGHSVFILDGDDSNPVSSSVITQDKLKYYTEYADPNATERKIYLSYEPLDNDGNLKSRYWVVNPDNDLLIPIEYDSSGKAVVNYENKDISLNDFFDKTCGEHRISDTQNYSANYTSNNIWDNNTFVEQTYGDTNVTRYLPKTVYSTWDEHQQTRWRMRMRGINNRMHGVYNKLDRGSYDKTFIGPLIATLKRYAIGLINKNIGTGRVDLRTGKYREGIMLTTEKVLKKAFLSDKESVNPLKRQELKAENFTKFWKNPLLLGFLKLVYGLAEVGAIMVCSTPFIRNLSTLATRGVAFAMGDKNAKNRLNWVAEYMHKEGFAEIQNTNINRVMNMQFKMLTLTAMILGLGLLGDSDDDSWWMMKWLSVLLLRGYSASALHLWPGDITPDDEEYFSEEHLILQANELGESYPFKITNIIKEILYRTWVEQASYNWINPFCLNSAISEFGNLFTNEIPAVSALLDVAFWMTSWFGAGTYNLEELEELLKEGKSIKNYVEISPGSGLYRKIIQSGINKGMYNTRKKAFSVFSPGKMFLPWRYGDETIKSIEYYQNRNAILSSWGMSAPKAFWNFFSFGDSDEEENSNEQQ